MGSQFEVTHRGINRDGEHGKTFVHLDVNGVPGRIGFGESLDDYEVHGKFASHTGFQRVCSGPSGTQCNYDDEALYARASEIAVEFYEKAEALPFLVGDEHKDFGWKKLSRNYKGQLETRLPDWHESVVSAELQALGITLGCPLNNYWVFEDDAEWDDAKAILAPLMAKGTRLIDERRLVQQFRDSVEARGFIPGELLSQGGVQPSLF